MVLVVSVAETSVVPVYLVIQFPAARHSDHPDLSQSYLLDDSMLVPGAMVTLFGIARWRVLQLALINSLGFISSDMWRVAWMCCHSIFAQ